MNSSIRSVVLFASLLLLGACGKDEPTPAVDAAKTGVTAEPTPVIPEVAPTPDQLPVEVSADAIAAGNALGANGAVSTAKASYGRDDTVYASMPTRGHAAGSDATVYWTYEDGIAHKEETKPIPAGAEFINFQFSAADGMKAGKYNVQIDVDFKPVGIVDFKVD